MADVKWNLSQEKIINHKNGNMIVSASAGSGKTTVMLERVLRLVEQGTPIDRIVILAFNNAIATEIRGKLYNKFTERLTMPNVQNKDFIREQIDRLPFSNIITNDAYCNKTTKEFFNILGISPDADILLEKESNMIFYDCFNAQIAKLNGEENSYINSLMLKFGGKDSLYEQVKKIHTYVSTQANGDKWLDDKMHNLYTAKIENSSVMQYLFEIIGTRIKYILEQLKLILTATENAPEVWEKYKSYYDFFESLLDCKDYAKSYILINSFELGQKERKSKKYDIDWELFADAFYKIKTVYPLIKSFFEKNLQEVEEEYEKTLPDVYHLVEVYKLTLKSFENEKKQLNKYTFSDFTNNVIKLLNNPEIRRELAKRYDYICVDEYQDTNYAQENIYSNISNGNNLFMVGDSKQSIYGFRLSDPNILINKCNDYDQNAEHGTTVRLDYNYRSDKGVVDFVNMIFNEIMTIEFGGIDYKNKDQLRYGADYQIKPSKPSAEIHLFRVANAEKQSKSFDEVYSVMNDNSCNEDVDTSYREGLFIASKIREIVESYEIYDTSIKDLRKVQYKDIALLARSSNSSVKSVIKALQDSRIPLDIAPLVKDSNIYEVDIIKEVLKVVDNDMQDYPLTAVLTSFWVGLDYDDLVDIREKNADCEYFYQAVLNSAESNKDIQKFYEMLADLRLKNSYLSIKELAEEIVFGYGYDKYVLGRENGDYKMSAIKTYLQSLGDLSDDCSLTNYIDSLTDEKMEIKSVPSENMVTAMTIHKSKGLEYPVVFVCNIEDELNKQKGLNYPKMQINQLVGIAINSFDDQTMLVNKNLVFDVLLEKNKQEEKAEAMRLFYVALTRPKNHIFLTGMQKNEQQKEKSLFEVNSFLDWVSIAEKQNEDVHNMIFVHEPEVVPKSIMERYSFGKYDGDSIGEIDKYLDFAYPFQKETNESIKYSVTEINELGKIYNGVVADRDLSQEDEQESDSKFSRAHKGTSFHAVMEHIDFNANTAEKIEQELLAMQQKDILTAEEIAEIDVSEVLQVMNSPIIEYAKNNEYYREHEFTMFVQACEVMDTDCKDKILVQGAIDLLIVGEKMVIVDFKKSNEPTSVLVDRYKKQLAIYKKAVESAFGKQANKTVLYVIGRNEIIDIEIA